ncbi:Uncharacterized protein QTN25_008978 [Entamoeba marina]
MYQTDYDLRSINEGECTYLHDIDQYFIPTLSYSTLVASLYAEIGCETFLANVTLQDLSYHLFDTFIYTDIIPTEVVVNLKYGCDNSYGINYYQLSERNYVNDSCYIEQTASHNGLIRTFYDSEDATEAYRTETYECGECFDDTVETGIQKTVDCSRIVD